MAKIPEEIFNRILHSVENIWLIEHKEKFSRSLEILKTRHCGVYLIDNDRPHLVTYFRYNRNHPNLQQHIDLLRLFF